jgi:DNA-binding PadR family transcriptional regulator
LVRGIGKPGEGPFGRFACLTRDRKATTGRAQRVFDHGELRFVILHLISKKPRHGYDLIKAIEEKLSGMYSPSPGVVYPTLTHLEECGLIAGAAAAGGKRLYSLTDSGIAFLADQAAQLDMVMARFNAASCFFKEEPPAEVQRAMRLVAHALATRLGQLSDDPAKLATICDLLCRLAAELEDV